MICLIQYFLSFVSGNKRVKSIQPFPVIYNKSLIDNDYKAFIVTDILGSFKFFTEICVVVSPDLKVRKTLQTLFTTVGKDKK